MGPHSPGPAITGSGWRPLRNKVLRFIHSLWMRLVFGCSHACRYGITFAHVGAVLGGSIASGSTEVVDFGSQISPNNSIRGAVCLSQSFG
jgi:hypothetical protein